MKGNWRSRQIVLTSLNGKLLCRKTSDQLEIKCDDNEQYSERTSIRIHGIEVPENESIDNVMPVVKSCHDKINVPFDRDNIDRVHRIGKKYTDENTGKKIQSIIVKMMLGQEIFLMVKRNQV